MAEDQDKAKVDANANGAAGGNADGTQKTDAKPLTEADIQREADRRVNEAQKKWKADLDAAIADKTKDADAKLAELTTKAEEAARYATFLESASAAGIRNVKAAYAVAVAHGHLSGGKFDLAKFKTENPEFFAPTANANAGNGAGTATPTADVNAFIRSRIGGRG